MVIKCQKRYHSPMGGYVSTFTYGGLLARLGFVWNGKEGYWHKICAYYPVHPEVKAEFEKISKYIRGNSDTVRDKLCASVLENWVIVTDTTKMYEDRAGHFDAELYARGYTWASTCGYWYKAPLRDEKKFKQAVKRLEATGIPYERNTNCIIVNNTVLSKVQKKKLPELGLGFKYIPRKNQWKLYCGRK